MAAGTVSQTATKPPSFVIRADEVAKKIFVITDDNQFHLSLALGRGGWQRIDGRVTRQTDGSLAAEAIIDGRCPAKIRVVSLRWPSDPALRGSLRLEIPYWLGDYLYTPEKYEFRCERAANFPDFRNLAPSGDFYELIR